MIAAAKLVPERGTPVMIRSGTSRLGLKEPPELALPGGVKSFIRETRCRETSSLGDALRQSRCPERGNEATSYTLDVGIGGD